LRKLKQRKRALKGFRMARRASDVRHIAESLEDRPLATLTNGNTFGRADRMTRKLRAHILAALDLDELPAADVKEIDRALGVFVERNGFAKGDERAVGQKALGQYTKLRFVLDELDDLALTRELARSDFSSSLALLRKVREQLPPDQLQGLHESASTELAVKTKSSFKKHSHAGLGGRALLEAVIGDCCADLHGLASK
jgi:hypothetical protein